MLKNSRLVFTENKYNLNEISYMNEYINEWTEINDIEFTGNLITNFSPALLRILFDLPAKNTFSE